MHRSHPIVVFATSVILSTLISAQIAAPVCCMGYSQVDETTLYIHGGLDANRMPTNQFIALDLTIPSWLASAPPWSTPPRHNESSAPPTSSWHSMATSKDRRSLFIWDSLQTDAKWWWTYSIPEKSWSNFSVSLGTLEEFANDSLVLVNVTRQAGIRNGVDLTSGNVYIPAGTDYGAQLIIHTVGTNGLPLTSQPSSFRLHPFFYASFVWSMYRNSFLHYGGRSVAGNTSNPLLLELQPMYGWVTVDTIGSSPGDVSGHCMVSDGGKKMIVFGGTGLDGIAKDDLHIFHVHNSTWTTGISAGRSQARTNMACAVAGDSFIAWGGENANVIKDTVPIIYDMRNNEWTTQFKRFTGEKVTDPTNPTRPAAIPSVAESTTNMAAIGSGIAGAVVVVAVVGLFFYRRRITISKKMHDNKKEITTAGLNIRDPQNTGGDPEAELLRVLYPSSPSPGGPRPIFYDWEEVFRRLAASPLAGPHTFMRDPQGVQQNRSTSGNDDKVDTSSNGSYLQRPSLCISPRSPHMYRGTSAIQDWPGDDDDNDDNNAEHQGEKSEQPPAPSPPSPPTPRSPQMNVLGRQDGPSRVPQWQQSLLPVVYLDHSQYVERSQELAFMMDAIRAEQEVLERKKLIQDAMVAQMRVAYPDPPPPKPSPDLHK